MGLLEAWGGLMVSGSTESDWAQVRGDGAEVGLLAHPLADQAGDAHCDLLH